MDLTQPIPYRVIGYTSTNLLYHTYNFMPQDLREGHKGRHRVIEITVQENLFRITPANTTHPGPHQNPVLTRKARIREIAQR